MSDFHAHVTGLEGFLTRFRNAPRIVTEELERAGKKAGLAVESKAKGYAPVWRGHLRRSITSRQAPFGTTVTPLFTTTRVGTNVPYAKAMEYGTGLLSTAPDGKGGRHWPPPQALDAWAISKGFHTGSRAGAQRDAAASPGTYGAIVAHIIGIRGGLKPRPYLMKAFNELKPQIRKEFELVPKRVIARLKGGG